jgi:hypothetical protein
MVSAQWSALKGASLPQHEMLADVRFGSKADMCAAIGHVRFTPERTCAVQPGMSALGQKRTSDSFDQLVSASDQRVGDVEPKRFGGFEVDHQLIFSWCLHRHISWFLTFEDAIDVAGR